MNNMNLQTLPNPRAAALKNELDALKKELQRTRSSWHRLLIGDEIRSVCAELAKYMN